MGSRRSDQSTLLEGAEVESGPRVHLAGEPRDGRYAAAELLGRGGTATVHRARDSLLLREVAVKRLDSLLGDAPELDRLFAEAQITAQLDHPNIVPVHDVVLDEAPYIVMKLVGGRTLRDLLADSEPPRPAETLHELLGVFLTVCDAVAFAHSRGVVHRDLKPANVMVDTYGRVYVMDWGIARVIDREPGVDVSLQRDGDDGSGTLEYMAPEQAAPQAEGIGRWTDVFALGAILYEILAGRPPHTGVDDAALRAGIVAGEIPDPAVHVAGGRVPPLLARIALRATARDPRERYASVDELRADTARFVRGLGAFERRVFPEGALVVREGEAGDEAFVITDGRALAFVTKDAEEHRLREMQAGDVFGELAALSSTGTRTASVRALTELSVYVVSRASLADGLGLESWTGAFVRSLASRFREAERRLADAEAELARLRAR
ncbi:MAG: protein kinase [Polyangiaceae bacterium]|nr:protein kinase [Polyangiaceae bacterium]